MKNNLREPAAPGDGPKIVEIMPPGLLPAGALPGGAVSDDNRTQRLDAILLHRYAGFPIMILCFVLLFATSFTLGKPVSTGIGELFDRLVLVFEDSALALALPSLLMGLISDGILRGIGSALAFFPQMLIFYVFYTLVTDTGYAERIAYLMHRPMRRINMDGKSFAPLILGYGCNVTAILGTNSIPSRTDRLLVMLVSTFTPCSARLGVIIYLAAAFFSPFIATLVMSCLIVLSWLVSAAVSFVVKRKFPGRKKDNVLPHLPAYHIPTAPRVLKTAAKRTLDFLNRIKNVVIVSSIVVWFLSTFPLGSPFEYSYSAMIGKSLEPVGKLAGLNWELIVALIFGFFAKETTLSTLGILYHASSGLGDLGSLLTASLSPLSGFTFLIIYMLYIPCVATVTTIIKESNSRLFGTLSVVFSLFVAFTLGIVVYNTGLLIQLLTK